MAVDLLENRKNDFSNQVHFQHALAGLRFRIDDVQRSVRYFHELLLSEPKDRQYRHDTALAFISAEDRKEAVKCLSPVIDPNQFPLPQSMEEYYADGFANLLLERFDRA